jgi:RNA polymerase sigma-70 factor, ECF subfamily
MLASMAEGAETPREDVTVLLHAWRAGDRQALEALMPLVYRELHLIAARYMSGERRGHVLQSTALVNEAFLKLVQQRVDWQSRAHFFAIAASAMRRILVDHARKSHSDKRGNAVAPAPLDEAAPIAAPPPALDQVDAFSLDRALRKLEAFDPQQGRVVELRFFGGLSVEETADVLGVSATTVKRDWAVARAWLLRAIEHGDREPPDQD